MRARAFEPLLWFPAITLFLILVSTMPLLHATPVESTNWDRDLLEDLSEDVRFALATVMSLHGDIIGYFVFNNDSTSRVVLEGARTPDREFWPSVKAHVGDSRNGPWTTCPKGENTGEIAKLQIEPTITAKLVVDLNVFRPHIGIRKYGRLMLNSGDCAVFELDKLRPPTKSP